MNKLFLVVLCVFAISQLAAAHKGGGESNGDLSSHEILNWFINNLFYSGGFGGNAGFGAGAGANGGGNGGKLHKLSLWKVLNC